MKKYDKKSFLAGIAVGRQLKGWATAEAGGGSVNIDGEASHIVKRAAKIEVPPGVIPTTFLHPIVRKPTLIIVPHIIPTTYVGSEEEEG